MQRFEEDIEVQLTKLIRRVVVSGIVVISLLILGFMTLYTIESGEEGVLLTFGKASPMPSSAGLHAKIPFVQKVVKFDIKSQKYGADATQSTLESAASKDLQIVKMQVVINYRIAEGMTPKLFTAVGKNYRDIIIVPTIHEVSKATTAQYTAVELITLRDSASADMENLLKTKLQPYNIIVEQVSITSFDFSEQFNQAIEAKVTAEQQKLKAENDLMRIRVEADQIRTKADAERDAAIAQATGEAERVRLVQEQLSKSPQYVEYVKASKWDGKYPSFLVNGGQSPSFLMQLPVSQNAAEQ
jgi:prohibitin 2